MTGAEILLQTAVNAGVDICFISVAVNQLLAISSPSSQGLDFYLILYNIN